MATMTQPGPGPVTDEDLMQLVQADDVGAFEQLYDRYSAKAFGIARLICGSTYSAEDALQDGFVAVWRARSTYDCTRGTAQSWILMLVRYRSLDVVRRTRRDDARREPGDVVDRLLAHISVERDAEQHDEASRIRRTLRQLPMTQREVIVLAYFAGLTHTEIAALLNLPAGTVKGRMRLGLQKLRAEINPTTPATHCVPTHS